MKSFARKHGILLIVLGVLLVGAAVLAASLFTAAKAETVREEALVRIEDAEAQATPELTLEDSLIRSSLEHRRRTSIPVMGNVFKEERGEWAQVQVYDAEAGEKAKAEFIRITEGLFGYTLRVDRLSLEYWKDETGYRDDYWRISDADALAVGCLKAKDLSLLAVDFDCTKAFSPSANPADSTALLKRLTDTFGGTVASSNDSITMSRNDGLNAMANLEVVMDDGSCYLMGHYKNTGYDLYAVSAHPNANCMSEHIQWTADAEFSEEYIRIQSPPDFQTGEPEAGDMTREEAIAFYQRFVTAAKGSPDEKEPAAQFRLDKSGARENCWELAGTTANLTVAAKTKRLIYTTINEMDVSEGTAGHAVSKIAYEQIEQNFETFYAYARHIAEYVYGNGSVANVSVNAVADGIMCTIDVYMENESAVYELAFLNSVLSEIDYYESEELFWYGYSGWPANFLSVNIATGETFYPQ